MPTKPNAQVSKTHHTVHFMLFLLLTGMLHVGDIILEVNGLPVATPEQLMEFIIDSDPDITLKIIPSFQHQNKGDTVNFYVMFLKTVLFV